MTSDAPIPLSRAQIKAVQDFAADDRLWSTKETTEFNLFTFARLILKLQDALLAPPAPREVTLDDASLAAGDDDTTVVPAPREVRVGVSVRCATCGDTKRPVGRSMPLGVSYCDDDCPGYHQAPFVGSLFPGETSTEFGYPVSDYGTIHLSAPVSEASASLPSAAPFADMPESPKRDAQLDVWRKAK